MFHQCMITPPFKTMEGCILEAQVVNPAGIQHNILKVVVLGICAWGPVLDSTATLPQQ